MKSKREAKEPRTRLRAVALFLAFLLGVPAAAAAQQTIFFVRHAERADGGAAASMTGTPADPLLSDAGRERAERLSTMLADAGIKAIFATEFHRTQDTGKPLAARLGLTVQIVPASQTAALVEKVTSGYADQNVLVVGHSNTVPAAIRAFGGPAVTMRDDEYDALYILNRATGTLTLIRF